MCLRLFPKKSLFSSSSFIVIEQAGFIPSFKPYYIRPSKKQTYFVQNRANVVVGATELFCYTLSFTNKRPALPS